MIATAALGYVVKHPREIGNLWCRQPLHDFGAPRELMIIPRQREAAQVAYHEQGVGIHGIRMKKIVLHASHDSPEWWYVTPQHAVEVHAPQFVGYARRGSQDLQEKPVIPGVLAKLVIDQMQAALERVDCRGAHTFDLGMLLQQQEQLQDG